MATPIDERREYGTANNPQQNVSEPGKVTRSYSYSLEEMRIIRECNKESLYYRSLPLAGLLGAAMHTAVKLGYLKPNQRWGSMPKVLIVGIMGFYAGKVSYLQECARKLMELPNSQLAEALRKSKRFGGGQFQEMMTLDPGFSAGSTDLPFKGSQHEMYYDINTRPMDLETDRAAIPQGLDDYHRPTVDISAYPEEELPPPQTYTTYDELRRKNRDEYEQKRQQLLRQSIYSSQSENIPSLNQPSRPPSADSLYEPSQDVTKKKRKNQYGDVWDE